jgi:hypothetical protein
MGEFRLPSGAWGTDVFPDWKMKIIDDVFTIIPVGTDPATRNAETLFSIEHTGNISCHYSLNIGESINVNGQPDVPAYFGGNLGICKMNPNHALDVLGDINATGYIGNGALITNITFLSGKWYGDTDIHYPTNISIGSIIANASLDVNGTIYADYDNDTPSFFGKTVIGSLDSGNTDIATMSHLYHNTLSDFAILQSNTGKTVFNSNTSLSLKIDNQPKISITNTNIIIDSNLQINGSLTIKGDNTNLNSYNISIRDPIFSLNTNSTGNNLYDTGILIDRGDELNVAIIWDESDDIYSFVDTPDVDVKGNLLINNYMPLKIDLLHANGSQDPSYFLGNILINGSISTYNVDVFGEINANAFLVNGTPLNIPPSSNIETVNIYDLKSTGTPGGTFTYGVWQIRDLNTINSHITSGSVTLSSNQFTITAGTYFIKVRAPAYNVNHHKCRLYNVTDSIIHAAGTNAAGYNSATSPVSFSLLESDININSNKTYRIEHWSATTRTNDGYGSAMGQSNIDEIYTSLILYKLS